MCCQTWVAHYYIWIMKWSWVKNTMMYSENFFKCKYVIIFNVFFHFLLLCCNILNPFFVLYRCPLDYSCNLEHYPKILYWEWESKWSAIWLQVFKVQFTYLWLWIYCKSSIIEIFNLTASCSAIVIFIFLKWLLGLMLVMSFLVQIWPFFVTRFFCVLKRLVRCVMLIYSRLIFSPTKHLLKIQRIISGALWFNQLNKFSLLTFMTQIDRTNHWISSK